VVIIVPAHDEGVGIGSCLSSIQAQDYAGTMRVVVVANGCTDRTADVARRFAAGVQDPRLTVDVVEVARPGKAGADVRIYLDADVVLSANAISAVMERLAPGTGIDLAAPLPVVARPASRLVRSYAAIWGRLPYVLEGVIGCGFYAVTSDGRQRWDRFPEIISDDKFVRLHFQDADKEVATEATVTIFLPERFSELLQVRARWCRGNRQLRRLSPDLHDHDRSRVGDAVAFVAPRPGLWPHVPVFALVYLVGKVSAALTPEARTMTWQRASTSPIRQGLPQPSVETVGPE
jgi:glycosyltransferase involved in cell wall biosynthesis